MCSAKEKKSSFFPASTRRDYFQFVGRIVEDVTRRRTPFPHFSLVVPLAGLSQTKHVDLETEHSRPLRVRFDGMFSATTVVYAGSECNRKSFVRHPMMFYCSGCSSAWGRGKP